MGRIGRWASRATILDVPKRSYWSSTCNVGEPLCILDYHHCGIFLQNFLAHKGGRRDLLASTSPVSSIQEGGPVSCCAHHAGISVGANQLQHTCGGPVVEGQLPTAVAAHPNSHGPQQHSHARHGLLSRWCHSHVMAGLSLKGQKQGE